MANNIKDGSGDEILTVAHAPGGWVVGISRALGPQGLGYTPGSYTRTLSPKGPY